MSRRYILYIKCHFCELNMRKFKTLSVFSTLLIVTTCESTMVAEAKSEFNVAVEQCVNQVRLGDGHTNQDISRCLAESKGVCAVPTGFSSPYGEEMGWEFRKRNLLTCLRTFEKKHEVCDVSIWIKFIPEEERDPENAIYAEQAYSNINCIDIPKNS